MRHSRHVNLGFTSYQTILGVRSALCDHSLSFHRGYGASLIWKPAVTVKNWNNSAQQEHRGNRRFMFQPRHLFETVPHDAGIGAQAKITRTRRALAMSERSCLYRPPFPGSMIVASNTRFT